MEYRAFSRESAAAMAASKIFGEIIRDGHLSIPAEPGWGVQVNEDWLAGADLQRSE